MKILSKLRRDFPKDWPTRLALIAMLVLAAAGAVYGFRLARRMVGLTTMVTLPGDPVLPEGEDQPPIEGPDGLEGPAPQPTTAPEVQLPDPDPWDGRSRVNVLIMGLDRRDDAEGTDAPRTDTMILLSMDPLNNAAAVIAIPRDMWVAVPGFGYYKINTAFRLGELYNLPGGGPGLAARTVEEFLGVPVHFYAQVDFQAFVDFIDHINGIKITVDEPFTVDRRGKWNTVVLEPGTYVLDGEYALAYARNRSTAQDDFDRSQRQMEVILAIRQRILEFDQLPHLVLNAPNIYEDLSAGIRTNMSLEQVIQLAWKAREIPRENIHMAVIGPEYVTIGASPEGLSILKPIPDKIRLLRDEVLGAGGVVSPMAEGDLLDLVAEENAQIHVLNGSGVAGLATRTTAWLEERGFNALESGNAAAETTVSKITIQGSCPYALRWLVETFGMTAGAIQHDFVPDAEADLILILGSDWAANNPIP